MRLIIATIFVFTLALGGTAHAQAWHGLKNCAPFSNSNTFVASSVTWQPWTEVSGAAPELCLDTSGHALVFSKQAGVSTYKWIDTRAVWGSVGSLGYYPTFTSCGNWPYHTIYSYTPYGSYTPYSSVNGTAPTVCIGDYGTMWVMAQESGTGAFKWVMTDDVFGFGN